MTSNVRGWSWVTAAKKSPGEGCCGILLNFFRGAKNGVIVQKNRSSMIFSQIFAIQFRSDMHLLPNPPPHNQWLNMTIIFLGFSGSLWKNLTFSSPGILQPPSPLTNPVIFTLHLVQRWHGTVWSVGSTSAVQPSRAYWILGCSRPTSTPHKQPTSFNK